MRSLPALPVAKPACRSPPGTSRSVECNLNCARPTKIDALPLPVLQETECKKFYSLPAARRRCDVRKHRKYHAKLAAELFRRDLKSIAQH